MAFINRQCKGEGSIEEVKADDVINELWENIPDDSVGKLSHMYRLLFEYIRKQGKWVPKENKEG
jgi:hypothetical protein